MLCIIFEILESKTLYTSETFFGFFGLFDDYNFSLRMTLGGFSMSFGNSNMLSLFGFLF